MGQMLENMWGIMSIPDNFPILIMAISVGFFLWLSFKMGIANDRLRAGAKPADGSLVDVLYPESERGLPAKVHVWPYLVRVEFLAAILVTVALILWSILLDAPMEERANPNATPNPSKAPWYFLGLQELLVYFDPWIAGVVLPTLIVVGLMVIPYVDTNPKGNGYYTLKERPFAIATFLFGFVVLWVSMVVIGTYIRGPGWMWFWPWQEWDPKKTVAETNVDLYALLGFDSWAQPMFGGTMDWFGAVLLAVFAVVGMALPYLWLRAKHPLEYARMGFVRYNVVMGLMLSMIGVLIKIVLRLAFHVKYVWVTPWFNI